MENSIYNSPLVCFCYIIEGITGYVYCGITSNLGERLEQHNTKKSDYKTPHRPFKYIYIKKLYSRKEARYFEVGIKAYGVKKWYTRELLSGKIESSKIIIASLVPV